MEYRISIKSDAGIVTFTITDDNAEHQKTITIGGDTLTIKIVRTPPGQDEQSTGSGAFPIYERA